LSPLFFLSLEPHPLLLASLVNPYPLFPIPFLSLASLLHALSGLRLQLPLSLLLLSMLLPPKQKLPLPNPHRQTFPPIPLLLCQYRKLLHKCPLLPPFGLVPAPYPASVLTLFP